jgi:uncharacterized repeat protein (TIGR03803 family)
MDFMRQMQKYLLTLLFAVSGFVASAQTFQTLFSFNYTNGAFPGVLTLGNDGNLYGTTSSGGVYGYGNLFKTTTNGALTTLMSFNRTNGFAGLTLGNDGNLYGMSGGGSGSSGYGTISILTTNGSLTTLGSFNNLTNGSPNAGLVQGSDGNFYGTTSGDGSSWGSVFKVTTNGALTTLISFGGTNGGVPYAGLTVGNDGNYYGTTMEGGDFQHGTVFKITTNGIFTTLFSFNVTNGTSPYGGLTLGNDGNFYGTTYTGGSCLWCNFGTVFQVTTNGTLTSLHSFEITINGINPLAGLTPGCDGNFYGTTVYGGTVTSGVVSGNGTIFSVTTNGTLTKLFSFTYTNGSNPRIGMTLGNDGNLYGTTGSGGSNAYGTVFRLLLPPAPPNIIKPLPSKRIPLGGSVSFNAFVSGTPPLQYQWLFNDTNIVGATNATYIIPAVVIANTGNYSVMVTNLAGSVTSSNALLVVLVPPSLALHLWAGYPLLNLNGMLSNNFTVQYSPDLTGTNWITLQSFSNLLTSPYLFLDPAGMVPPARFYRVWMQ